MNVTTNKLFKPYRFIVSVFLALVISFGFVGESAKVFAIPDVPFYSGNDILYYDPDDAGCATGGGSLTGTTTKQKIWNYLLQQGLTDNQAAGLMGNIQKESQFSPTVHQDTGKTLWDDAGDKGWGLVQWDSGRRYTPPKGGVLGKLRSDRPELEKYTDKKYSGAKEPGSDFPVEDFDAMLLFQLEYMKKESEGRPVTARQFGGSADTEWERMKEMSSLRNATLYWERNFEVSGDSQAQKEERVGFAQAILDEFGGTTATGGGSSAHCSTSTGSFSDTVLSYAWPEYKGRGYLTMKPEYAEAVEKAQNDNPRRYVGGDTFPGVDCGGFVTLLLTDSGFEPEYNHGGVTNQGAGNTEVQSAWTERNWERLGIGTSINVADLQPGDVAHRTGHTFIFVGEIPGFDSDIASASLRDRAPMAGRESPTDFEITWYRKK